MVSATPNAIGLGPLETIVNVGWGQQDFTVLVSATSAYDVGAPGSRSGSVSLTEAGRRAGGVIVFQESVNEGFIFFFNAELYFKTNLGTSEALFDLNLNGATIVPQEGSDPPLVPPFCGTTTTTSTTSAPYKLPNPFIPGAFQYFEDHTTSISSPAGGSSAAWTAGPLAGGSELDTAGSSSLTGSSQTIWYRDSDGNWVDTGLSCDLLDTPEGPDPTKTNRIEGFGITISVFDHSRSVQGPHYTASLGPTLVGLNSDFVPVFDTLPDGGYSFAVQRLFVNGIPPTDLGGGRTKPFQSMAAFPVSALAPYSVSFLRDNGETWAPPQQTIPGEIPPGATLIEKQFPPGGAPPANTGYSHRP
jgi:hypothetical protein